MTNKRILIIGSNIIHDRDLLDAFRKNAFISTSNEIHKLAGILQTQHFDMVILELTNHDEFDVEIIKEVKKQFPHLTIILIDGESDRELIARCFNYGVKDAFRKPYENDLLVERAYTLME